MADAAYMNAQRRRDELAKEINDHQQAIDDARKEMARVENFLQEWRRFAGVEPEAIAPTAPTSSFVPGPKPVHRVRLINPSKERVGDAVARLIEARGAPIPRRELSEGLAKEGVKLFGKDPEMVLSTMLWRMQDRFVRIPNHGYWLADKPHVALGYDPNRREESLRVAKPAEEGRDTPSLV